MQEGPWLQKKSSYKISAMRTKTILSIQSGNQNRVSCKNTFFLHPELLDFCILIVKIVLDMKPLYINVAKIAFSGKMEKCIFVCGIGRVKQTFKA